MSDRLLVIASRCGVGARRWVWLSALLAVFAVAAPLRAEDAPEPPQVVVTIPLGVVVGEPVKIRARGLRLEGVTEVRATTVGVAATLLSQGKVGLPNGVPAAKAGDTQVEVELRFTPDLPSPPPAQATVVLVAPHGEATLHVAMFAPDRGLFEVEENPGFDTAQRLALPPGAALTVLGAIARPQDVDVFRIEAEGGRRLRVGVDAGASGSVLDALLTIHDAAGAPIATADDAGGSRDPTLDVTLPRSGPYFLVLQDANDAGGDAHPYRLSIASEPVVAASRPPSFVRDVAPILQARCVACHGPGKAEGGWRADSFAALRATGASGIAGFAAGQRDASEALGRITSTDPELRMPLNGAPLSAEDVGAITRWIDAGLPFDGLSADALLVDQIPPPVHPPAPAVYAAPPPVTALTFTPTGELLVGGWREVLVIDPLRGSVLRRIGNVAERSSRIAVHPGGDRFAVAGGNPGRLGEVRIFRLSGELLAVLAPGADVVHDAAWSPAGDRLAVASSDASVRVFDADSGALVRTIAGHRDWVLAVAWSPDGDRIATGSRDRTAKVFDAASGALLASYGRHDAPVRGILFAPSGEEMLSASDAQKWDRWKLADAAHVRDTHLGGEVFQLAAAGEFFVAPSANGRVHLFKALDGEKVREYQPEAGARFVAAAASPAADLVAAGTQDGRVVVWRLSTGERLVEFPLRP